MSDILCNKFAGPDGSQRGSSAAAVFQAYRSMCDRRIVFLYNKRDAWYVFQLKVSSMFIWDAHL